MSHPTGTPAWGTPTGPATTGTNEDATQAMPPLTPLAAPSPRPVGPTKAEVELRVTALHYAEKILGDQATAGSDVKVSTTLSTAKTLEKYLLTGQTT